MAPASRYLGVVALALSASLARAETAADYFVHSLPGAPAEPPIKMHAG
jgi:carboxypeptidase D